VVSGVVVGGTVVGGGGGGVFVIVSRHGEPVAAQFTNLLARPTGNVMSTVFPGKPVSVTVSRVLVSTSRPPWGTPGAAVSM
jgi:hypothetical protein